MAGWSDALKPRMMWRLMKDAASDWSRDRAPRLGAALAYYTVFSLVPFLVVVIAVIGLVFGEEAAQSAILSQIAELVGEQTAAAIKDMIQRADQPSTGLFATGLAVATLILGASGVFGQLQDALNTVWGVEPKEGRGVWGFIKDRFLSFVAVLGTGFLLLVSLILSSALGRIREMVRRTVAAPGNRAAAHELRRVIRHHNWPFRADLQSPPRCQGRLEGCLGWSGAHIGAVHHWKICSGSLFGQKQCGLRLWRSGILGSGVAVGLLFSADPLIWCRVHPGVCEPCW